MEHADSSFSDTFTDNESEDTDPKSSPVKRYLESQSKRKHTDDSDQDSQSKFIVLPKKLDFKKSRKSSVPLHGYCKTTTPQKENTSKKQELILDQIQHDTWVTESTPHSFDELCIHKKKLSDLRTAIENLVYRKTPDRILIVSGPCGSGKSTAVKVISNSTMKEKIDTMKRNMLGSEISDYLYTSTESGEASEYFVEFNILKDSYLGNSSVSYFEEFLNQCKLLTGLNEKCIIIEELPNIFHKETHVNFQKSLQNWIDLNSSVQLPPVIICVTEFDIESDSNWNNSTRFTIDNFVKVETVLGYGLMQYKNNGWANIKFNKVAKTILKGALIRVVRIEGIRRNRVIDKKIDELSELGDLRNAINTLEFWYKFQYTPEDETMLIEDYGVVDGKETGLDIFHCIGKIIYGTKHQNEEFVNFKKRHNLTVEKNRIDSNIVTADNISSEIMSHLVGFNLCCLESYYMIDPPINSDLNELMEILSISDDNIRRCSYYDQPCLLQNTSFYSCLGLRIACEKLKDSRKLDMLSNGKKKVIFSRDSKLRKKKMKIEDEVHEFQKRRAERMKRTKNYSRLTSLECILIDGYYQSNILSSFKFRYQMFQKTGRQLRGPVMERLGGKFVNTLTADDEFNLETESEDEDMKFIESNSLEQLEKAYFGVTATGETEDGFLKEENSDGELDSDPIENSDDDLGPDHMSAIKMGKDVVEDDIEDTFSDDSAVLNQLF